MAGEVLQIVNGRFVNVPVDDALPTPLATFAAVLNPDGTVPEAPIADAVAAVVPVLAEPLGAVAAHEQTPHGHPDLATHTGLGLAPAHAHPYAATSHAHVDADIPATLARDAEVAATYAPIHAHPYAATAHVHDPVHTTLANGATAMGLGTNDSVKVTPTASATYTTTVPAAGHRRTLIILTSGTTSRTITFGTGFKPVGTLATGILSARVFVLQFVSDGTNLYEASRTVAMVA